MVCLVELHVVNFKPGVSEVRLGLTPTSDGLQPSSDGLHTSRVGVDMFSLEIFKQKGSDGTAIICHNLFLKIHRPGPRTVCKPITRVHCWFIVV